MRYYIKKPKGIEGRCVNIIERGIQSIKNGNRCGEDVGKDLEYFFNKLETLNKGLYDDLFKKYCLIRLEASKKLCRS